MTYINLLQSGAASTQKQGVEQYMRTTKRATARMVATFLNRPEGIATARLDDLMQEGIVVREETEKGKVYYAYEADKSKRPANVERYNIMKVCRQIDGLKRATERAGVSIPGTIEAGLVLFQQDMERGLMFDKDCPI